MDYLDNVDVPKHKQRERSERHVINIENTLERFKDFLKKNNLNAKTFPIENIDDNIVGKFYEYCENLTNSVSSFNHHMKIMRAFINYVLDEHKISMRNPFRKINLKYEEPEKIIVTKEEFGSFLEKVSPDNSVQEFRNEEKKKIYKKNRYRPWLKNAYKLAILSGRRREDVLHLRWSDIHEEDGKPVFIECTDHKADRLSNYAKSKATVKAYIPVIPQLRELLYEMGYDENKGSSEFIIGQDERLNRASMIKLMSSAFSLFWKKVETTKKATQKALRKTYFTAIEKHTLGAAIGISNHSRSDVLQKHYIDRKEIAKELSKLDIRFY